MTAMQAFPLLLLLLLFFSLFSLILFIYFFNYYYYYLIVFLDPALSSSVMLSSCIADVVYINAKQTSLL